MIFLVIFLEKIWVGAALYLSLSATFAQREGDLYSTGLTQFASFLDAVVFSCPWVGAGYTHTFFVTPNRVAK